MQILVMKIDVVPRYRLLLGSFKSCNSIQKIFSFWTSEPLCGTKTITCPSPNSFRLEFAWRERTPNKAEKNLLHCNILDIIKHATNSVFTNSNISHTCRSDMKLTVWCDMIRRSNLSRNKSFRKTTEKVSQWNEIYYSVKSALLSENQNTFKSIRKYPWSCRLVCHTMCR